MKKIAVLLARGFEEIEALTVVDVLRRAGMDARMVSLDGWRVTGSHGIAVQADTLWPVGIADEYDMVVLPGGLPGAEYLRDDARVQRLIPAMLDGGRFVAAICAAPIALEAAGVLAGRKLTSYPGYEDELSGEYLQDMVVRDGNLITSRGPATALPFAFALVEALGGDAAPLRRGMLLDAVVGSNL